MATQQHPALDPNQALLTPSWPRNGARRKDLSEGPRQNGILHNQLRSHAQLELQGWKPWAHGKRVSPLLIKWENAKKSLETRLQVLRNTAAAGQALRGDAKALADASELILETFDAMKSAIGEVHRLPQIEIGTSSCMPRSYAAVAGYLRAVDCEFDENSFEQYISALQEGVAFEMAELWQFKPLLELAILESAAGLAEQLDSLSSSFASETSGEHPEVSEANAASLTALLASLRRASGADWKELFEHINAIEHILRQDPCGVYPCMDFESRDAYRKTIVQLAARSDATEPTIAFKALELANHLHASGDDRVRERMSHIGYYLVGEGRKLLESKIGYRPMLSERLRAFIKRWPDFSYILSIELVTFSLVALAI